MGQKKNATDILKRFEIFDCNAIQDRGIVGSLRYLCIIKPGLMLCGPN